MGREEEEEEEEVTPHEPEPKALGTNGTEFRAAMRRGESPARPGAADDISNASLELFEETSTDVPARTPEDDVERREGGEGIVLEELPSTLSAARALVAESAAVALLAPGPVLSCCAAALSAATAARRGLAPTSLSAPRCIVALGSTGSGGRGGKEASCAALIAAAVAAASRLGEAEPGGEAEAAETEGAVGRELPLALLGRVEGGRGSSAPSEEALGTTTGSADEDEPRDRDGCCRVDAGAGAGEEVVEGRVLGAAVVAVTVPASMIDFGGPIVHAFTFGADAGPEEED